MSTAAQRAMISWVGVLARGGVANDPDATAGEAVAAFVVGEARLEELRAWLREADEATATRERRAAVEVCIAMAHADRAVHPEERHLLSLVVRASRLPPDVQDELVDSVHAPPPLDGVEDRLTHPVLRELILALAWELALADGKVDLLEELFFDRLAVRFGVDPARATELRESVGQRVG